MRQQIFEDALKKILKLSRRDVPELRQLLHEIEKIAREALKRDD